MKSMTKIILFVVLTLFVPFVAQGEEQDYYLGIVCEYDRGGSYVQVDDYVVDHIDVVYVSEGSKFTQVNMKAFKGGDIVMLYLKESNEAGIWSASKAIIVADGADAKILGELSAEVKDILEKSTSEGVNSPVNAEEVYQPDVNTFPPVLEDGVWKN